MTSANGSALFERWSARGEEVSVVGLGKSGVSATLLLRSHGIPVYASDTGSGPGYDQWAATLHAAGAAVDIGGHDLRRISHSAAVVVAPGVPPNVPALAAAREADLEIYAEVDIGFLWFNAHPAEVFMGDTGSLAIGGALGTVAILLKAEFLLLLIGGVFAAEAISVLIQTGAYKWFKRTRGKEYADAHRVFRMAPLHHHFEKLGWAETTVVTRFYILGLLCALVALSTLKVR